MSKKNSSNDNFNDFANFITNTALKSANDVKNCTEQFLKDQIETILKKLDVVTRKEFEVTQKMAKKALEENLLLKKEIEKLKKKKTISKTKT